MGRFLRSFACGVIAASVLFASPSLATPPVFTDLTFETASAQAVSGGKILIFDAMTSWCGPCKVMDKTAWVDADVVAWIKANAIAIQLDMDKHPQLREAQRINAYPTVIVYKDGKEFDRIVGLRTGPALLEWLKGVSRGESKLDQTLRALKEERAKESNDISHADLARRFALADDLYDYGSYDEATTEAVWLWERRDAAKGEDFASRLGSLMGNLARRHPAAKARFTQFRDAAAAPVAAGSPTLEQLTGWLRLNAVIDDSASSVEWALKMTDTPDNLAALKSVGPTVFPLLVNSGEWATAGKSLADPVVEIDRRGASLGAYDMPVADAPKKTGGAIPAIPLMRKPAATATAPTPAPSTSEVKPAIPLMRTPAAAEPGADVKQSADAPKTMPAIPLVRKIEPAAEQPKTVPAIPLMRKSGESNEAATIPAIPVMGDPGEIDRNDPASVAREVRYRLTIEFRGQAATYYAACLAAGRNEEAARIAELTFKYTDSPASRLALAEKAMRAGQTRPEHVKWMEEIETAGKAAAALRTRIQGEAAR